MLRELLKHPIRKTLLYRNRKFNHIQLRDAMFLQERLSYLARRHKFKLIGLIIMMAIGITYNAHIKLYKYLRSMSSMEQSMVYTTVRGQQPTITEQQLRGIELQPETINTLLKIFHKSDFDFQYGVGRKYLCEVYKKMGMLTEEKEQVNFMKQSGFFKKSNQAVSGVTIKEFLSIFEEAHAQYNKNKQETLTEEQFLESFISKMEGYNEQHMKWEKEFNEIRQKEYLNKSVQLSQKKKLLIMETLAAEPQISKSKLEAKIRECGLMGLSLSDQYIYWQNRFVLFMLKLHCLKQEASQLGITPTELDNLENSIKMVEKEKNFCRDNCLSVMQYHQQIYNAPLI